VFFLYFFSSTSISLARKNGNKSSLSIARLLFRKVVSFYILTWGCFFPCIFTKF
jgi:hypothetical protein